MAPSYSIHTLDTSTTSFHNPVVQAFFNGSLDEQLLQQDSYATLTSAIDPLWSAEKRRILADELLAQYRASEIELSTGPLTLGNIEALRESNTFTVTTGQQVHVMLGPVFMANKLLAVCAHAKKLSETLEGKNVVPIFWLASEDHDFDEIKTAKLYNETYTWDEPHGGAVGRMNPNSLVALVEAAQERADKTEANERFFELCKQAYGKPISFAQATRYILHHWFEDTGIVILDADSPVLKSWLAPNIHDDLFEHANSSAINHSIGLMKASGVKAPINTRPINYFLLGDQSRNRIERDGDQFKLLPSEESLSANKVEDLLKSSPEVFSPNALLRPVYQQMILPNLAYLCGGGEFKYWLELKHVMDNNSIVFPRLEIRPSVFYTRQSTVDFLAENSIPMDWVFLAEDEQNKQLFGKMSADQEKWATAYSNVDTALSTLEELVKQDASNFSKRISKVKASYKQLESDLAQATSAAQVDQNPVVKKFKKLAHKLWSADHVQERHLDVIQKIDALEVAKTVYHQEISVFEPGKKLTVLGIS